MSTLKTTLVSGFKWTILSNVLQRVLAIAAMAILARRLEPTTFGLFALAFVAIDGLMLFQTLGLNAAVIQQKDLDDEDTHTAFVLVLIAGLLITAVCWLVAPLLAGFFQDEAVADVIRALGILFIIGSFSRVPGALINRQMRFRLASIIAFVGAALNSILSVVFVLISPTVWSLVLAYLAKQLVTTALLLYYSGYRPRLHYDQERARKLFSFGGYMIGVGILAYLWMSVDSIVVGRVLGTALLGYFTLGTNISNIVNKYFANVISVLMFPAMSRMQDDSAFLQRAFLKTTRIVSVAAIPFGLVLVTLAEPIVLTLYGDRWLPTIPLVRILGMTAAVTSLTSCAAPMLRACGRPQYDLGLIFSRLLVRVPLLVYLSNSHGLIGAAIAGLISMTLFTPVTLAVVRKVAPFRYRDYLSQFSSVLAASAVMVAAILLARLALESARLPLFSDWPLATVAALGTVAAAAFGGSLMAIDRPLSSELLGMVLRSRS